MMASAAPLSPARRSSTTSSLPARLSSRACRRPRTPWVVIGAVLICFVSLGLAAPTDTAPLVETSLIDDGSPQPEGRFWVMRSEHHVERQREQKRATSEGSSTTNPASDSVTTTFSIAVGTPKPSSTSTSVSTSPLPSILDSLSSDFSPGPNGETPPCPIFINSFLRNDTFKQCYPLSMLFERSESFFEAQKSLVSITRTLDATCAADAISCNDYMQELAGNLVRDENCGLDFRRGDPAVVDAYVAMRAYAPVYSAGCLKDPDTGAYCYARAVTNATNPSATYFYFLPLNQTLPGSTVPACDDCLRQTMALYQAATADRRQMIAATYVAAARQVNTICGPGFVNESLAAEVISSGGRPGRGLLLQSLMWATALPLLAAVLFLV
ncbi:hypothetical protein VTK56DRAFT_3133 [Thermocarpiscus australiensis]